MARDPYLENEIMDVLWDTDAPMTPGDVRDAIAVGRPIGYTTVMTVMTRLWKKGRLEREKVGRAFAYMPAVSRGEHAAQRMEEILDTAGDRGAALARFTDQLSTSERKRLKEYLEQS